MKKILSNLLLLVLVAALCFSGWQILQILRADREVRDSYDQLEQYVSFSEPPRTEPEEAEPPTSPAETVPPISEAPTEPPDDTLWPTVDFDALIQINPDIVGWIYIEGTSVNYPIVQGTDNEFYLNHLFDGTWNRSGCIFLDAACPEDLSGRNSILHGHNMLDGAMFSDLTNYSDQSFYEAHPLALLLTPERKYRIRLFSGYVASSSDNAWHLLFSDDGYELWLDGLISRSEFRAEQLPTPEHKTVTFSTCTYEFNQARFVLHGFIEYSTENG